MMGKRLRVALMLLIVIPLCAVLPLSAGYRQPVAGAVQRITQVHCQTPEWEGVVSLPTSVGGLPPRSQVTLTAEIDATGRDSLLIKSVFAPAGVYLNGVLVRELGVQGSYPGFMRDPPTTLALVPLPEGEGAVELRIEYRTPTQRGAIALPAVYTGSETAITAHMVREDGFSLLSALILIFLGAAMVLVSLAFVRRGLTGIPFLWLGLFSLAAGAWVLGECDLSALLIPYPALLYALDYLGLFFVTIFFLRFGLIILGPRNRRPLTALLCLHSVSVAAALLLQLFGLRDFTRTLYWFHIICPLAFVVFSAQLLWEHFRHGNQAARRFGPAAILLAASILLEVINYWAGLIGSFTVLFQMGVLGFIIWLGVVSGYYVRESMHTAGEKLRLEYEGGAMGRQLELQRGQYERMMQDADALRAMRHDMRHHAAAIGRMADAGENAGIKAYVSAWEASLTSTGDRRYCKNHAVNAVAAHYLGQAGEEGIGLSVRLEVPEQTGCVPALDLCVITGNFIENALEACRRMEHGERFIRVRTRLDGDTLSIAVTNSFDGLWSEEGGRYRSRKSQPGGKLRLGAGLESVQAVCARHRGLMQVEINGGVWKSLALVHMEERAPEGGEGPRKPTL